MLQQGADPNTMANLHVASSGPPYQRPVLFGALTSPTLIKLLIEHGADISKVDTLGCSALSHLFPKNRVFHPNGDAIGEGGFHEIIKVLDILNESGLRLTEKDMRYAKPNLELLRRLGHNSLVEQIEAHGRTPDNSF